MLECTSCNLEYPAGKKFCKVCGGLLTEKRPTAENALPILPVCSSCGERIPTTSKFCKKCGAPVVAPTEKVSQTAPSVWSIAFRLSRGSEADLLARRR